VGAAWRKMDGMAMADPMRVCGRVNRHRTMGKGGDDDDFCDDSAFPLISISSLAKLFPTDISVAGRW